MKKLAMFTLLFALFATPAWADSVACTVVQTGFSNLTKTVTLTTSEINRIITAYQPAANVSVNGTATRAQVLNYWVTQELISDTVNYVKNSENQAAISAIVPPTPINPQ